MNLQSKRLLSCLLTSGILLGGGCHTAVPDRKETTATATAPGPAKVFGLVSVSRDGRHFIDSKSGQPFRPWGVNYDRDYRLRLIEDYWIGEWPTVIQDFQEMRQLGVNVVRVHLQFGRFMTAPRELNKESLGQLIQLIKLAESMQIRLDLTGLGCYRKELAPPWYSEMSEAERWAAQARFWQAIARCSAGSPAVFCYDLMNEPMVPMGKRPAKAWLTGELAGLSYVQFISLDQAERNRSDIARAWIREMTAAIRLEDKDHLITVGMLPFVGGDDSSGSGFNPEKLADLLDFISVHLYPRSGKLDQDRKTLERFAVGKPLVMEETAQLSCGIVELRQFVDRSADIANGWLGFYWGQTPGELAHSTNNVEIFMRDWLDCFQKGPPAGTK